MLTVQTVRNQLTVRIKLVNDPVCILLHTSSENYYLVVLSHLAKELVAVGSDEEVRLATIAIIDVMDQCFVKVEHQGVFLLLIESIVAVEATASFDRLQL